jgi:hypothetical protein
MRRKLGLEMDRYHAVEAGMMLVGSSAEMRSWWAQRMPSWQRALGATAKRLLLDWIKW